MCLQSREEGGILSLTAQRHLDVTMANDEGGGKAEMMFVAVDDIRGRVSVKMSSEAKVCFFWKFGGRKRKKHEVMRPEGGGVGQVADRKQNKLTRKKRPGLVKEFHVPTPIKKCGVCFPAPQHTPAVFTSHVLSQITREAAKMLLAIFAASD